MADLTGFRAKTVTFSGTAILGIQDASDAGGGGDAVNLDIDASANISGTVIDGIYEEYNVTTTDINRASAIAKGDNGSLVILYEKRADGRAAASSGNKTATMANATVIGKSSNIGTKGVGSVTITFRAPSVAWS